MGFLCLLLQCIINNRTGVNQWLGRAYMARPMNRLHQDDVRKKIQASQLINVLHNHAVGQSEELSMSRLKAIEILLRKSLPDLSAITISGDEDSPLVVKAIERVIVDPKQ